MDTISDSSGLYEILTDTDLMPDCILSARSGGDCEIKVPGISVLSSNALRLFMLFSESGYNDEAINKLLRKQNVIKNIYIKHTGYLIIKILLPLQISNWRFF